MMITRRVFAENLAAGATASLISTHDMAANTAPVRRGTSCSCIGAVRWT
jgi:hypothetical protein